MVGQGGKYDVNAFDPVMLGTSAVAVAILLNRRWLMGVGKVMAGMVGRFRG